MKTNIKPKFTLKQLFENMSGDTYALRDLFSENYDVPKWKLNDYINHRAKALKIEHALNFVAFYNQYRLEGAEEITVEHIQYTESVLNLESIGIQKKK